MIVALNILIKQLEKKKPWKYQGFNRIRTRGLRDTGAILHQLSYEATHWERKRSDHRSNFFLIYNVYDVSSVRLSSSLSD